LQNTSVPKNKKGKKRKGPPQKWDLNPQKWEYNAFEFLDGKPTQHVKCVGLMLCKGFVPQCYWPKIFDGTPERAAAELAKQEVRRLGVENASKVDQLLQGFLVENQASKNLYGDDMNDSMKKPIFDLPDNPLLPNNPLIRMNAKYSVPPWVVSDTEDLKLSIMLNGKRTHTTHTDFRLSLGAQIESATSIHLGAQVGKTSKKSAGTTVLSFNVHNEVCRVRPKPEFKEALNDRFRSRARVWRMGLDSFCSYLCAASPFDKTYGNRQATALFMGGSISLKITIKKGSSTKKSRLKAGANFSPGETMGGVSVNHASTQGPVEYQFELASVVGGDSGLVTSFARTGLDLEEFLNIVEKWKDSIVEDPKVIRVAISEFD
jgi:hypothetical protein